MNSSPQRWTKPDPSRPQQLSKPACLLSAGPVLSYRAFKQSGPRALRGIAINALKQSCHGKVLSVQVRFTSNPVTVFVKEDPESIEWPSDFCSQSDYQSRYHQKVNKSITTAIKQALIDANFVRQGMFPDVQ